MNAQGRLTFLLFVAIALMIIAGWPKLKNFVPAVQNPINSAASAATGE